MSEFDLEEEMPIGVFLVKKNGVIPFYATEDAACFDIALAFEDPDSYQLLAPGASKKFSTGIILKIPKRYHVKLHVRSSTGIKRGLTLSNSTGIIDADYTKELFIGLRNNSKELRVINSGDVLVQGELRKNIRANITRSHKRPTQIGNRTGGCGSTG